MTNQQVAATPTGDQAEQWLASLSHCTHTAVDLLALRPVKDARDWADKWLKQWSDLPELVRWAAIEVISELVTNAVRRPIVVPHRLVRDPSPIVTLCVFDEAVGAPMSACVTVSDFGQGGPEPRVASEADEDGRGLIVVAALCSDVVVRRGAHTEDRTVTPHGKRIVAMIKPVAELERL